jgi:hypothetical protein
MPRNWNDVLNYIKRKLPKKIIELSDKEIIDIVKNITLPEFSNYVPVLERYVITNEHLVDKRTGTFRIPFENEEDAYRLIDIYDVYLNITSEDYASASDTLVGYLLGSWVSSARASTSPIPMPFLDKTRPPGYITFNTHYSSISQYLPMTVILKMRHKDPSTIPYEAYYRWFLPIALGDVCLALTSIRSDFSQLSTPIGQISLEDPLIQQYIQNREEKYQELKMNFNSFDILLTN